MKNSVRKIMSRRNFLGLSSILLLPLAGGLLSTACRGTKENRYYHRFASILAGVLFGKDASKEEKEKIFNALKETAAQSTLAEDNLKLLFDRIFPNGKLVPEDMDSYYQSVMPHIAQSPEAIEVFSKSLEGKDVLDYLDYPDLPGDYGWCGYLVQDGDVWNRYHPK